MRKKAPLVSFIGISPGTAAVKKCFPCAFGDDEVEDIFVVKNPEISMKYEISNLFLANKITANTFARHLVKAAGISHRPSLAGLAGPTLHQMMVSMRGEALGVWFEKVAGKAAVKGGRSQAPRLLFCVFFGIQFGIFQ